MIYSEPMRSHEKRRYSYDRCFGQNFAGTTYVRFIQLVYVLIFLIYLLVTTRAYAQDTNVLTATVIQKTVEAIYQPRHRIFVNTTEQFLDAARNSCQHRSDETLTALRDQFTTLIIAYSSIELYRAGPMLKENRQNRLFFWPDKRNAGERQLRALLANEITTDLTAEKLVSKSVALQGLPATERLLFGKSAGERFDVKSSTPDCTVLLAIAQNMNSMATALNDGWASNSVIVKSMYSPENHSDNYRTEDEVLRSIVTQIIVGIDIVLHRKIEPLTGDNPRRKKAPLWLSEQTLPMVQSNLDSLRALVIESGLARKAGLEKELSFEFQTVNTMLQALIELPALVDNKGQLNAEAQPLIRALSTVTGAIAYTLNDRFVQSLGISAGFNSEDGD